MKNKGANAAAAGGKGAPAGVPDCTEDIEQEDQDEERKRRKRLKRKGKR